MAETEPGFDFDAMALLARDDPAGFDRRRAALIADLIRAGRRTAQLASLQQSIDAERRRMGASAPASAAEGLAQLMWSSFGRLTSELERLAGLTAGGREAAVTKLGAGEAALD